MARRRPVYITPGRHPFEVGVLLACVLVGSALTIGDTRPPSLMRGLPEPLLTLWLLLIALGGIAGLIGAYWRGDVADGLLIEVGGVCAVAAAMTLYSVVLLAANPWPTSIGSAGLLAGIAVGATGRTVQCIVEYRRLRAGRVERVRIDLPLLVEGDPPGDGEQQ